MCPVYEFFSFNCLFFHHSLNSNSGNTNRNFFSRMYEKKKEKNRAFMLQERI